jgi:8-oxo-dGTP pyrophosphatase MutT (NUDIX family)
MDLTIALDKNSKLNYRICAILIHDHKVLLQGDDSCDFWVLPGGRCKFGETSDQAIRRELKEELGIVFENLSFLHSLENLFILNSITYHEISFFYKEILNNIPTAINQNNIFKLQVTDNPQIKFKWINLDEITNENLYPIFLRDKANILGSTQRHFIINEV